MIYTEDIFIDSGAWSLFSKNVLKQGKGVDFKSTDFSYYNLDEGSEFRAYCDSYAGFVKSHPKIQLFANVDVIGNPERTWDVQKFFEKEHGLRLVPVIHMDSSMAYIDRYLEHGYELIGFGGFASGIGGWERMRPWCDKAFTLLCPASNNHLPVVKVHGFAMTGMKGIRRWPWYSVDSTSWVIWPANGWIPVPHWTERGGFDFSKNPKVINVCPTSLTKKLKQRHAESMRPKPEQRRNLMRWLKHVGVPWGKADAEGKMLKWGVTSHHEARTVANLHFFMGLQNSLPQWPWPLSEEIIFEQKIDYRKGFGVVV